MQAKIETTKQKSMEQIKRMNPFDQIVSDYATNPILKN